MGNPFCHVELHSDDPAKSKEFYKTLFDWTLEEVPMEEGRSYTMIKVGDGTGGGIMKNMAPEGTPDGWLAYIMVDDVSAKTKKAKELGAEIVVDNQPIPKFGKFSIIKDTTNAVFGIWEPEKKE